MHGWTGIELSPSRCNLAHVRRGNKELYVKAFELIEHNGRDSSRLSTELSRALETGRFPRRARVVVWGIRSFHKLLLLPREIADSKKRVASCAREELQPFDRWAADASFGLSRETRRAAHGSTVAVLFAAASRADIAARLTPVSGAGFRIESVVTPALALATLARTRAGAVPGAVTAFLALNRDGGAVAVVRGERLLFAWDLVWEYRAADRTQSENERLLQRYLFVSRIAPELHRVFKSVEHTFGFSVERVVTCGDLPDLRSLAMPLIEEFDVEVDTMDSTDGVNVTKLTDGQNVFVQQVAALRVVCSVAALPPLINLTRSDTGRSVFRRLGMAAAGSAGGLLATTASCALWLTAQKITPPVVPGIPPAHTTPIVLAPRPASGVEPAIRPRLDASTLSVAGAVDHTDDTETEPRTAESGVVPDPVVQFILFSTDRRLAVVDGQMVGVGDTVGGFSVVDIARDVVVLDDRSGRRRRIGIKEPYAQPRPEVSHAQENR